MRHLASDSPPHDPLPLRNPMPDAMSIGPASPVRRLPAGRPARRPSVFSALSPPHREHLRHPRPILVICCRPFQPAGAHPHPRRPAEQPEGAGPGHPHRPAGGGHRCLGQRQVLTGLRHPLRRGPASLCRDLLGLRPPVPRSDGSSPGRQHRRRAARHRHRPDQPGAHLALHGRHDDRAERPSEAADGPRRHPVLPAVRPAGPGRRRGQHRRHRAPAGRRAGGSPPLRHLPGSGTGRLRRTGGHRPTAGPGLHPHPPARGSAQPRRERGNHRQDRQAQGGQGRK